MREAVEQEYFATGVVTGDAPVKVFIAQAPPGARAGDLLALFGAPPGCAIFQGGYILGSDSQVNPTGGIVVLNAEDFIVCVILSIVSCVSFVCMEKRRFLGWSWQGVLL